MKKFIYLIAFLSLAVVGVITLVANPTSAILSPEQREMLNYGYYYYSTDYANSGEAGSGGGTGSTTPPTPNGTIAEIALAEVALWNSGTLNPGPGASGCGRYGAGDTNCSPWCAYFVSWVFNQAGFLYGTNEGVGQWLAMTTKITSPEPGDLAFYTETNNINNFVHVNIVVSSNGDVVGGNEGGNSGGANTSRVKGPRSPWCDSISCFSHYGRLN